MSEIYVIPGTSPAMTRVLTVIVFAAGFCFALSAVCDLAKVVSSRRGS